MGFPIRRSTDQRVLAPPRGLSQRATSFIASQCQGIHRMPFRRLISATSPCAPRADPTTRHPTDCKARIATPMSAARAQDPAAKSPGARSAKSQERHRRPTGLATASLPRASNAPTPKAPAQEPQRTGRTSDRRTRGPNSVVTNLFTMSNIPAPPVPGHRRRPPRNPPDRPMPDLLSASLTEASDDPLDQSFTKPALHQAGFAASWP